MAARSGEQRADLGFSRDGDRKVLPQHRHCSGKAPVRAGNPHWRLPAEKQI